MGQVDFIFAKDEKLLLAQQIFKSGMVMIPDLKYETEEYKTIVSITEYEKFLMTNELMFLVHPATFKYSLEMRMITKNNKQVYYIQQKHGGPTIDFYSPGLIEGRDNTVGVSFLGNYSFYYSDQEKFRPSNLDKELFGMLTSFVKTNSKKVKLKERTFWIGNKTIALCRTGKLSLVKVGEIDLLEIL